MVLLGKTLTNQVCQKSDKQNLEDLVDLAMANDMIAISVALAIEILVGETTNKICQSFTLSLLYYLRLGNI